MDKNRIIIITGANRGLGKAIVDYVIKIDNVRVISLSRSVNEEHHNCEEDKFIFLKTDLSEAFPISILTALKQIIKPSAKIYFFNNASIILPIDAIGNIEQNAISTSLKVNIEFPVNLVNTLMEHFSDNEIEFVNITSGAGVNPVPYWSLYGASKAYMKMFFKVLMEEQKDNKKIAIHDISPGVLDTDMQKSIRENAAPKQDYFLTLKDENKLINPMDAVITIFNEIKF